MWGWDSIFGLLGLSSAKGLHAPSRQADQQGPGETPRGMESQGWVRIWSPPLLSLLSFPLPLRKSHDCHPIHQVSILSMMDEAVVIEVIRDVSIHLDPPPSP